MSALKQGYQADFGEALSRYRSGDFDEAQRLFDGCRCRCPADTVALKYVDRCKDLMAHPPPTGWDGVTAMHK